MSGQVTAPAYGVLALLLLLLLLLLNSLIGWRTVTLAHFLIFHVS